MSKENQIQWINGLRGIACLGVAIHHFLLAFFPATHLGDYYYPTRLNHIDGFLSTSALGVFINGSFYVCLFCCLSGYVLSLSVMKLEQKEELAKVITKRYLRLALPVFFLAIIVSAMMHLHVFSNGDFSFCSGGNLIDSYYSNNLRWRDIPYAALVSVWFFGDTSISPVFWMLSVLFKGSFLAILLSATSWKLNKKLALPFYLLLIIPYVGDYKLCFVFGVILSYIQLYLPKLLHFKMHSIIGTFFVLFGLFLGGYPTELYPLNYYELLYKLLPESFETHISQFYHMIGAFLFILGIMLCGGIQKALSTNPLIKLGRISFAVYLVHMPLICSFSTSFFKWLFTYHETYAIVAGITFILTISLVLVCATVFHYIIEKPCDKFINLALKHLYPAS